VLMLTGPLVAGSSLSLVGAWGGANLTVPHVGVWVLGRVGNKLPGWLCRCYTQEQFCKNSKCHVAGGQGLCCGVACGVGCGVGCLLPQVSAMITRAGSLLTLRRWCAVLPDTPGCMQQLQLPVSGSATKARCEGRRCVCVCAERGGAWGWVSNLMPVPSDLFSTLLCCMVLQSLQLSAVWLGHYRSVWRQRWVVCGRSGGAWGGCQTYASTIRPLSPHYEMVAPWICGGIRPACW
jgi:hypothetical protein